MSKAQCFDPSGPLARAGSFDTAEVRWFADGELPAALVEWFPQGPTSVEIRRDRYRLDGSPDVGLKRRNGGPAEVKIRCDVTGPIVVAGGLRGRLEEWHKLEDIDAAAVPGGDRWIDVDKVVLTRTYRLAVDGVVKPVGRRDLTTPGCDIELAVITIGEAEAWTFALEAWGPPDVRPTALRDAMAAFVGASPLPARLLSDLERDAGYPEWLTSMTSAPGIARAGG